MDNYDIANNFFIKDYFNKPYKNVSFRDGDYYSYGTVIARKTKDLEGNNVLVVADRNLTMTTAKHRLQIMGAAGRHGFKICFLPQNMWGSFDPFYTIGRIEENLIYFANAKLTRKPNREGLIANYFALSKTLQLKEYEPYFERINELLKQYKEVFEFAYNYKR